MFLVSLPLSSMHISDFLSNIISGFCYGTCDRSEERVPRGVVRIGVLASEGDLVVWSCR